LSERNFGHFFIFINAAWRVALGPVMHFAACMKTLVALLFVVTSACTCFAEPAKTGQPAAVATTTKNVSPDEAEALIKNSPKLVILDVRTPDEFAAGHIAGAKNADFLGDDFEKQIAALDPAMRVLVHCAAGSRSAQAVKQIEALKKFELIYHLQAGFKGWAAAKKPVEGKPGGK
jgi:rhodanese-related sulfurtransferase